MLFQYYMHAAYWCNKCLSSTKVYCCTYLKDKLWCVNNENKNSKYCYCVSVSSVHKDSNDEVGLTDDWVNLISLTKN